MAIYKSNLVKKLQRHRGIYGGKSYDAAGRIFLPAGTALAVGDVLLFLPVGENQAIEKVSVTNLGSSISGSIGTFQIKDKAGNAVVVRRKGPSSYAPASFTFTSPADAPTAIKAAGALTGYTEALVSAPAKLAGPVNVGIRITTAATLATDTEIFLAAYFDGEVVKEDMEAGYPPRFDYLLD